MSSCVKIAEVARAKTFSHDSAKQITKSEMHAIAVQLPVFTPLTRALQRGSKGKGALEAAAASFIKNNKPQQSSHNSTHQVQASQHTAGCRNTLHRRSSEAALDRVSKTIP
jgi:hypothetical protein